jgi:hypothetical protein
VRSAQTVNAKGTRSAPPKTAFTVRALRARTVNAKEARSELTYQILARCWGQTRFFNQETTIALTPPDPSGLASHHEPTQSVMLKIVQNFPRCTEGNALLLEDCHIWNNGSGARRTSEFRKSIGNLLRFGELINDATQFPLQEAMSPFRHWLLDDFAVNIFSGGLGLWTLQEIL